jgi:hypothetical protein
MTIKENVPRISSCPNCESYTTVTNVTHSVEKSVDRLGDFTQDERCFCDNRPASEEISRKLAGLLDTAGVVSVAIR